MESDSIKKKVESTIKLLSLSGKSVEKVLDRNKEKELQKTLNIIESQRDEIDRLKLQVQATMFAEREDITEEEVSEYSESIDVRLEIYGVHLENIQAKLDLLKKEEVARARNEFEEEEQIRAQRRYEEEKKIEEMRLQMKTLYKDKNDDNSIRSDVIKRETTQVKLPKLVITKFQGNHLDWLRFNSQFQEIDHTPDLSAVSKFSYLKELLIPRVRLLVDGLSFTAEGYSRAKGILESKFGKPSEVANAHILGIIN